MFIVAFSSKYGAVLSVRGPFNSDEEAGSWLESNNWYFAANRNGGWKPKEAHDAWGSSAEIYEVYNPIVREQKSTSPS